MLHPSRCCARGVHIATQIDEFRTRCVWCGVTQQVSGISTSTLANANREVGASTQPETCCDSATRQVNYPRPTITERHDDISAEFDERFRIMARGYAEASPQLRHWSQQGNKLPSVYR